MENLNLITHSIFHKTFFLFLCLCFACAFAEEKELNLYIWYGEVPDSVIRQFEKETGIHVNYSTYNSNETLYTKLKAAGNPGYDVIEPSSYYVDRMRKEGMLQKLDKQKLPLLKHITSTFAHPSYDPNGDYSVPYMWGTTGIFVNKAYVKETVEGFSDFWQPEFLNRLLLLDDPRDVFPMALKTLGYSANDSNPTHLREAYEALKRLSKNVKLYNSDAVTPIIIDDEAQIGMIWNGDLVRAKRENPQLDYIYPKEGFVIWVDAFAIPEGAPHIENAHRFINFLLRPEIAAQGTLHMGYAVANEAAKQYLPENIRLDPVLFPDKSILQRGEFQIDINDAALDEYERYWEALKMGAN